MRRLPMNLSVRNDRHSFRYPCTFLTTDTRAVLLRHFLLLFFLFGYMNSNGQSGNGGSGISGSSVGEKNNLLKKTLSIGDKLRENSFLLLDNGLVSERQLSAFKGRILILDFFATWCGACIAQLPKLNKLQQQYPDRIQVMLVASESREKIVGLQKRNRVFAASNLPIILEDSMLHSSFAFRLLPHIVWIGADGIVKAISSSEYVSKENIDKLLDEGEITLPLKNDLLTYDRKKPLYSNIEMQRSILYSSTLTGPLEGVPSAGFKQTSDDSSSTRYTYTNMPLLHLLTTASKFSYSNRWILEVKDSSRFYEKIYISPQLQKKNYWCYEIIVPATTPKATVNAMTLHDLERYFKLQAQVERRYVQCFALVHNKSGLPLQTKGGRSEFSIDSINSILTIRNESVDKLVQKLNYQRGLEHRPPVVVNETGINFHIDLDLQVKDLKNINQLRNSISRYGLDLIEVYREVEFFVVKDQVN